MYIKRQEEYKFMIRIENLSVSYKETLALKDISLVLHGPTITGIIGPNGAGKSTLLKGMLGIIHSKVRHFSMTRKLKNPYIESPMSNKKSISTTTFPSRSRNVSR